MMPGRAILAAIFALPILIASSPALAEHGPGWATEPLLQRLAQLLDVEQVDLEDQPELPRGFLIDPTEEAACFQAPGESARLFKAGEHSSGVLVGDEDGRPLLAWLTDADESHGRISLGCDVRWASDSLAGRTQPADCGSGSRPRAIARCSSTWP